MASLRYSKRERHPFSRYDERVEVYPELQAWRRQNGESGFSPSDTPLDELSFMYFLRTLLLETGDSYEFNRHFEAGRNPVRINVLGRERVETELGTFAAIAVELRVRDRKRYAGDGLVRIHLSDDAERIPLRISSDMPLLGTTVLTLSGRSQGSLNSASAR